MDALLAMAAPRRPELGEARVHEGHAKAREDNQEGGLQPEAPEGDPAQGQGGRP